MFTMVYNRLSIRKENFEFSLDTVKHVFVLLANVGTNIKERSKENTRFFEW